MSATELDGLTAFDNLLDRYESCIRNEGAQSKRVDDARDAQRQAERELESCRVSRDHWMAVAEERSQEIGRLRRRVDHLTEVMLSHDIVAPPEQPPAPPLADAPNPADDGAVF